MLSFVDSSHSYTSLPGEQDIQWVSGTHLVGLFKQPFPADGHIKASKNSKGKWYKMDPNLIRTIWDNERDRSAVDGTFYHLRQETQMLEAGQLPRGGRMIPVVPCVYAPIEEGKELVKLAPVQKLEEGIYPEHFLYLKSAGICGQADICERVGDVINIGDYKTNKDEDLQVGSHKNWEGISKKMLPPLQHMEDCKWSHYCLQLSLYMYIALKHNPQCKPGKMTIYHVKFKHQLGDPDPITGKPGAPLTDPYGYPLYERDADRAPIVDKVIELEVPYLKREVEIMLRYLIGNRHKLDLTKKK